MDASGLPPNDSESEPSTLWRVSGFDRLRATVGAETPPGFERQTVLSATLVSELRDLERQGEITDVLELVAACVRARAPALVYLRDADLVWPVTLFPAETLYHSPRSLELASDRSLAAMRALGIEPPAVRPPGHWMHERVARSDCYHPLTPVLWRLALHGPRTGLLGEIGGVAAYRVLRSPARENLPMTGAVAPAVERLRREAASLSQIASWPGMSTERASALLNALYLTSNLIVSRTHPQARAGSVAGIVRRWLG
jgi:hypothetical protein